MMVAERKQSPKTQLVRPEQSDLTSDNEWPRQREKLNNGP